MQKNNLFPTNEADLNEQDEILREEASIEGLKKGSFILFRAERLMVEEINWSEMTVWASDRDGREVEVPFSQIDLV